MLRDKPRWWIGKDSLGIVYDVTHCYNLGEKMPSCILGFGRLCSKKKHMLLAVLIFFRNYAKIMLLSENYALCPRNYAT